MAPVVTGTRPNSPSRTDRCLWVSRRPLVLDVFVLAYLRCRVSGVGCGEGRNKFDDKPGIKTGTKNSKPTQVSRNVRVWLVDLHTSLDTPFPDGLRQFVLLPSTTVYPSIKPGGDPQLSRPLRMKRNDKGAPTPIPLGTCPMLVYTQYMNTLCSRLFQSASIQTLGVEGLREGALKE